MCRHRTLAEMVMAAVVGWIVDHIRTCLAVTQDTHGRRTASVHVEGEFRVEVLHEESRDFIRIHT